jgi:putative flippase GtrA
MSYTTPATTPAAEAKPNRVALHKKHGARQFVKFCLVGFSSTLINFGFLYVLFDKVHVALVLSLTIAFVMSMLNGFFWNRRWTFRESRSQSALTQSARFFAVGFVGWVLNTSIVVLIVALNVSAHGSDHARFSDILLAVVSDKAKEKFGTFLVYWALAVATFFVVFWNFFANRLWTFNHKKSA